MKFSTHVALPKHNIHVKYLPKIYVYSDVITFYNSLISFYVFSGLPTLNIFYPTELIDF